jgi:hypothetical protein
MGASYEHLSYVDRLSIDEGRRAGLSSIRAENLGPSGFLCSVLTQSLGDLPAAE